MGQPLSTPQLYFFKPVGESSEDDAFNDADGDRVYITKSNLITIDRTERTNETYLAKYTAPDLAPRELKYEWGKTGDDQFRCIDAYNETVALTAFLTSLDDFRFRCNHEFSLAYPTLLDAQLAAEYHYDNYIKKS